MIRSILLALDDTKGAVAARDLAIGLARRTGAALTAAAVLDVPHARDAHEAVPPGGGAFKERRDAARAARLETEADLALAACVGAAGETPVTPLRLTEAPDAALLLAGTSHDLIVIGRDSTLGLETAPDGLAPVIGALLQDGARPLLVVPPAPPRVEGGVLVAYDGSVGAQRALQLFTLLGLGEGMAARVVSVDPAEPTAALLAEQGAAYLRRHGMAAEAVGVAGSHPLDILLAEAAAMPARLLVMGAYDHSGLRLLFTGSATEKLLLGASCPVFVAH
ncbi:universal stress protein [Roseomonas terrae]|jgi:nucleotide-binding universal stress UspA family protein|uniref:Universal stress protein n=1 Tax=Neoroseomonas terrae TaxID=424799 RepID=A0ABS5EJM9_9PROT|nr:universal stress protein [Neoroseomonas terrae]MBR0651234.1 universal stress protein [Neoroseomonas terrae]